MTLPIPSGTWLKTADAIRALGISKATLYRRKDDGYFQAGTHFVTTGPSASANILWNVDEVRKVQGHWSAPASGGRNG